jgi:hypothetical protein
MATVVLSPRDGKDANVALFIFDGTKRDNNDPEFGLALSLRGRSDFWALKRWTVGVRMLRMISGHVSQSIPDRSRYVNYDYSKLL